MNYDVSELAQKTGYSKERLRKLLRDGKIGGAKLGTIWLATLSAVKKYKNDIVRKRINS